MYEGLLYFGGAEVTNHARTRVYADYLGLAWFTDQDDCSGTSAIGETYTDPATDNAPWVDPERPESLDFAGFYVLEIVGGQASTLDRQVTERLGNGGVVGGVRYAPRTLVIRGLLVGANEEAVRLGGSWLAAVLEGRACLDVQPQQSACGGFDLDYLALCPSACGCDKPDCDEACFTKWGRHMYEVSLTQGPVVLMARCLSGGRGFVAEVEVTLVAGNPFHYGNELSAKEYGFGFTYDELLTEFMPDYDYLATLDPPGYLPWAYNKIFTYMWDQQGPDPVMLMAPTPATPTVSLLTLPPLVDPDCPTPPAFPVVPQSDIYCGDLFTGTWQRTTYRMAAQDVAKWMKQLPIIYLSDPSATHQDIRIRFTPEGLDPNSDYSSEFYVTYLPSGEPMALNGPRNTVVVTRSDGSQERAEHLVIMDSRGAPLRWPVVDCGGAWTITVDVPTTDPSLDTLLVDLSLVTVEP